MTKEHILSIPQVRARNILRNVYMWMTLGLALTGIIAYGVSGSPSFVNALAASPMLFFGIIIAEFALVWILSSRMAVMSAGTATLGFAVYAALNGVTLSLIFLVYTSESIASAFFITAGTFAGMSFYGLTTKRDLSAISSYLVMGLWGLIVASVANYFFKSSTLSWIISYAGIAVFMGLTAWDTQKIKRWNDAYGEQMDEAQYVKLSILGALCLYLDFINLFLFFLRILGGRRR